MGAAQQRGLEGVVIADTKLSRVQGDIGKLTYCGYDIYDLAEHARFEEVAYLLHYGKLPTQAEYDAYPIATINDLVPVNGQKQVTIYPSDRGWKFRVPNNQKVLSSSITFNNEVFFVAFSPDSNAAALCAAGKGTNFLYRVSVVNGDPIADLESYEGMLVRFPGRLTITNVYELERHGALGIAAGGRLYQFTTVSPSNSSSKRSTPCVDGC